MEKLQQLIPILIATAVVLLCGLAFVTYKRKPKPGADMVSEAERLYNNIQGCEVFVPGVWKSQIEMFEKRWMDADAALLNDCIDNLKTVFNHRNIRHGGVLKGKAKIIQTKDFFIG